MSEEFGRIIEKGFETWKNNLNIALPFILDSLFSILFVGMVGVAVAFVIGFDTTAQFFDRVQIISRSMSEGQEMPAVGAASLLLLIKPYIAHLILSFLIIIIGLFIIRTFFKAGAIGMAKAATEKGSTGFADMMNYAKKHVISLLLTDILIGLFLLVGIVFLLPAALLSPALFSGQGDASIGTLILGIFLWITYMVIVITVLFIAPYLLVIEFLHPIDAIKTGFGFFVSHKLDVILLLIFTVAIAIVSNLVIGSVPKVGGFISTFVSIIIVQPLTTLWWVRLYMAKTNKPLYVNELLSHPDDLSNGW
ncbi:MAG: hypothetical protein AEth_01243 [Candidatus Argoarchaeum ethanivorans]|uniref:Glycerophosphoryl diester phosphodiesterase membrane domain-containing protein n=1 Tax=Candidatus Argoarchaeum ethanivorans TaxID=2608793 RepID=A0A8B3S1B6_9EURY|nr:MAG: hypothetical protein AEth_01243 [Candidatus Argoarchaeum ethanivorans]